MVKLFLLVGETGDYNQYLSFNDKLVYDSIDVVLTTSILHVRVKIMKRKIYKGGKYSYVVSIPKELVKELGWKEKQYVEITKKGKKLQVQDAP